MVKRFVAKESSIHGCVKKGERVCWLFWDGERVAEREREEAHGERSRYRQGRSAGFVDVVGARSVAPGSNGAVHFVNQPMVMVRWF